MGVLQLLRGFFITEDAIEARNLNNPSIPLSAGLNALSSPAGAAGVSVTVNAVLGLTEAWRALKVLAETIASVPFKVVEKMPDGTKEERPSHPVSLLFTVEPNQYCTPFSFMETMVLHATLFGNAYAFIEYNRRDATPRRLQLVEPHDVDVYDLNGRLTYKHLPSGKTYPYDEVLHIANTSWDGKAGLNVLQVHKDNFSLALANRNYGANFYRNGAQLSGVLKHPGALSKEAMTRLKESWRSAYEGASNAGRTAILEEGMDYTPITLKPSEASFAETKKMVVADMARIFGVPTFMLEDLDRATFSNIEHLSQQFLSQTIRPWCKRIESEINRKLFKKDERGRVVAFLDFDDLLVVDLESRANYARTLFNVGALSPNDIRLMSGMNPVEGGDKHYVQVNMGDIMNPPETGGQIENVQTLLNDAE